MLATAAGCAFIRLVDVTAAADVVATVALTGAVLCCWCCCHNSNV